MTSMLELLSVLGLMLALLLSLSAVAHDDGRVAAPVRARRK